MQVARLRAAIWTDQLVDDDFTSRVSPALSGPTDRKCQCSNRSDVRRQTGPVCHSPYSSSH